MSIPGDSVRVLFIHQNFPGQFRHAAQALARRSGTEVLALTDAANTLQAMGVKTLRYRLAPPDNKGLSRSAALLLSRYRRGETVARALQQIRERGFKPDVIVGHPGWGELMHVADIYPGVPTVAHAEYYYRAEGGDVGFDPEFPDVTDELRLGLTVKNLPLTTALVDCERAIAPTEWQASRFPDELRSKIRVVHEGIRTELVKPDPSAKFTFATKTFVPGDEVLTFVNRNLEPMRGFHVFMRALPQILAARPDAHVVIVGGEGVSYGQPPAEGGTWKAKLLQEVGDRLDLTRVHFTGQLPYASYLQLLQVSRLHVYLTYPFVLSWSMLEAMSAGALVLASSTPPVTEIIRDSDTGLLVDFFDVPGLAGRAIEALAQPDRYVDLRAHARAVIIDRYDLATKMLPTWLAEIDGSATSGRSARDPLVRV